MKKMMLFVALVLVSGSALWAQKKKPVKQFELYSIAFYNLENMFDTIHDEGKRDYDFTPNGSYHWNTMKYVNKLKNMSTVISRIAIEGEKRPKAPSIIGLSEVENYRVLEDLLKQPALKDRGYEYIIYEGPDRRGIDCALFYNPKEFKVTHSHNVPYKYENNDSSHLTRSFLVASGLLAGERLTVIVNHWPSRGAASPARERAGRQVRVVKDSIMAKYPKSKVVIMGDMNDDPDDKSMAVSLGAKRRAKECKKPGDLFNPFWKTLRKDGIGTLCYHGKWNLFDNIVINKELLVKNRKHFFKNDLSTLKFWKNKVFMPDYLFQQEGKYKGYPKRTHAGGVWLNGYADHLPTYIYLLKQIK